MKVKFLEKHHEAGDVWSFWFLPLEPMHWLAGQSVRLEIPAGYDSEERRFTIASAPHEGRVLITTRLSQSPFKKGLAVLLPETLVDMYAIEGDFIWGGRQTPRFFVASGIGITPFRSLLVQHQNKLPVHTKLLYAARNGEFAYKNELLMLQDYDPHFSVSFLSDQRVSAEYLIENFPDIQKRIVYVSGPSAMVDDIAYSLRDDYKLPPSNIRMDRFTGSKQFVDGDK